MKKNKRERDEDSVRHGDQYDTQLLWFLMRHMRNRRPQRVRTCISRIIFITNIVQMSSNMLLSKTEITQMVAFLFPPTINLLLMLFQTKNRITS